MAARSIWKGVIRIGRSEVPVKLYSAVQEQSIRFRLLHRKDLVPVKQQLVDSQTGDPVDYKEVQKAFPVTRNTMVVLESEELENLEPEPSRDIEITRFVAPSEIDHRWYERAYYLGPDTGGDGYFALAAALEKTGKEGIARWVMRKKQYVGALRNENGYLMLITLRHAEEVLDASQLDAPAGRALDARELKMAEQLVEALSGTFDPHEYHDEYRERVLDLVKTKARGGKPKVRKFRPRAVAEDSLEKTLAASLAGVGKRKAS